MFFLVVTIFFVIASVIGAILLFADDDKEPGSITLIASFVIYLLIFAFNVYTTVDAGHVKVGKLFGKPVAEYTAGFHFINPFYDLVDYDGRIQEYTRSGTGDEGAKDGYDAINATTKNNMEVYIEETIKWRLADGDPNMHHKMYSQTVQNWYRIHLHKISNDRKDDQETE